MLLNGLQELHEQRIVVPRSAALKPDPDLLEKRYARFVAAAG